MRCGQLVVARAVAQRGSQVQSGLGVETEEEVAVGGQPGAVAGAAERLGRRGDDAEDGAVGQPEPLRGGRNWSGSRARARRVLVRRHAFQDLRAGDHLVHLPAGGAPDVHVLDEPDLGPLRPGELEQVTSSSSL